MNNFKGGLDQFVLTAFMWFLVYTLLSPRTGYETIMFPRPALHNLLLSRVPPHKILLGKKVMSLLQNKEGVMIRCSDNTSYHGDILIGADGAYSGVRQSLYKAAIRNNDLPLCDKDGLNTGHICMVGTTNPFDPAKYPVVNDNFAHFKRIIGEGTPFSVSWRYCDSCVFRLIFSELRFFLLTN